MMMPESSPIVLTIAGSDPSGGAGIQADLKTITALGCYGCSAITALTAQNTLGVQGVHAVPPEFVQQQIRSVFDDLHVSAIKTGMLYDANNVRAVVSGLQTLSRSVPIVCDPVSVSTSGHTLLDPNAITALTDELFPLATLITPNKPEAELLLSRLGHSAKISSLQDMLLAAKILLDFRSQAVLLKGGHITITNKELSQVFIDQPRLEVVRHGLLEENMEILRTGNNTDVDLVADVLAIKDRPFVVYVRPRIDSKNTHGTGCTLSAAIACALAREESLEQAILSATVYTHAGIEQAIPIGAGNGPVNHLHSVTRLNIPRPTTHNPYPLTQYLIGSNRKAWKAYVEHDFVRLLGKGTLPKEYFVRFIKQDYHYLRYYSRAYALLAAKSPTFKEIEVATQTILNVLQEIKTHKQFCAQFGVSEEELERTPEEAQTVAYGAYIMDVGLQGDTTKLLMALLACLLGYGEVGLWIQKEAQQPDTWVKFIEDNPYLRWMQDYSGEHYQSAVKIGLQVIESRALIDPPSSARLEEWRVVWERCTLLEKGFWDMAMGV
ncbi:hypothetical protein AX16_008944 [Volvariella volvacea WC 439]|nr:hypothetical protein AX16_008944 [Volvariella volvacea WC 439]